MKPKFTSEIVIGMEAHIELATDSKLFCGCATHGSDEPNSRTCEICLGMPGSKPVLNKKAVEYALKLCLALNCEISPELIFSRKSYFYPDMAKNYQISQYSRPVGRNGFLTINNRDIHINRIHMEEDAGKLMHSEDNKRSFIDYNRTGVP